jgi:hypothetical protein
MLRWLRLTFFDSEFQNRRASATLTSASQGNPFRTLPKGEFPLKVSIILISFDADPSESIEPPPRDLRHQQSGAQQNNTGVVAQHTNTNTSRGGYRGGQGMGNMRGNVLGSQGMIRGGMGGGGMGGMGGGMGPVNPMNGMNGIPMGAGMNGMNPGMNMGMQQMMGNMMNMMNGFNGRGGGMIPSGPRGGMGGGFNNMGRGGGF